MTDRPKFFEWLTKQAGRDDPIGDLASDTLQDGRFPREATAYDAVRAHLVSKGACEDAKKALRLAWREYLRMSGRKGDR